MKRLLINEMVFAPERAVWLEEGARLEVVLTDLNGKEHQWSVPEVEGVTAIGLFLIPAQP